ncbi:MAG: adenosylmethionine decarboxylase [Thermofilum sp. ex4484_15]|nr:MAG: adenosylmethionine decarboxylase [Thermofilum sp. ex4484_15]
MKAGVGLGRQLIVELFGCDRDLLDSIDKLRRALIEAAKASRSTVIGHVFHKFSPQGVSGVIVIAESHLAIHTWPEYGYAAVDIFTCGKHTDPWGALAVIKEALKPKRIAVMEVRRGLMVKELVTEPSAI